MRTRVKFVTNNAVRGRSQQSSPFGTRLVVVFASNYLFNERGIYYESAYYKMLYGEDYEDSSRSLSLSFPCDAVVCAATPARGTF